MNDKRIEELEEQIHDAYEEIRKISAKNPENWQKVFMEKLGAYLDPDYPRAVRIGDHIIYCSKCYVSANIEHSELGVSILETMADIISRRLDGEDI